MEEEKSRLERLQEQRENLIAQINQLRGAMSVVDSEIQYEKGQSVNEEKE